MKKLVFIFSLVLLICGCVYYNTFYQAQNNFEKAEQARKKARDPNAPFPSANYTEAIKKASKVLEFHPKSKWVDDALLLIGKAYYYQGEYLKAERKFRELIAN